MTGSVSCPACGTQCESHRGLCSESFGAAAAVFRERNLPWLERIHTTHGIAR
ncbi:MAG: hypothetical protein ACRDNY_02690 [Gaiellaceae bacterium]